MQREIEKKSCKRNDHVNFAEIKKHVKDAMDRGYSFVQAAQEEA